MVIEGLGPVVDSIVKISNSLVQIEKMQHYLRVREAAHRDSKQFVFLTGCPVDFDHLTIFFACVPLL